MKDKIKSIATIFAIGFIVICGVRVGEWLIPKPETRVLICFEAENEIKECKDLKVLIEKKVDETQN